LKERYVRNDNLTGWFYTIICLIAFGYDSLASFNLKKSRTEQ